jgi:alpha-tubulin suppressor-like RCC1 family protein
MHKFSPGKATAIAAGDYHMCAILLGGSVVCWGMNNYGQLGINSVSSVGMTAGQMGSQLQPAILGTGCPPAALLLDLFER